MALRALKPQRLKSRMTTLVILFVLAATVLVTWGALQLAEGDMKSVIGRQQYVLLSSVAAQIDEQLTVKQMVLAAVADTLPRQAAAPADIHRLLENYSALRSEFSNVAVFDSHGEMLTSLFPTSAPVANVSSRTYFEQTLAQRHALISPPLRGRASGLPVVVLTHPVIDSGGDVQYVVSATIDLMNSDFFHQFSAVNPSKTGFLYIMTTDGILVNHPNKSRLLEHINARPGRNLATEKALAGFEGWTEAANKDGAEGIYSYKRLNTTNWIVAMRYPSAEAFAPLIQMRRQAVLAATAFAAIAGILSWWLIDRLLRPLERLRENVHACRTGSANIDMLRSGRHDEIGELSEALYELTAARQSAQEQLRDSERRARMIADNMPALIAYIDRDLRYRFTNDHYQYLLGLDPKAMLGRTIAEVFGSAVVERWQDCIAQALAGQRVHSERAGEELGRHMHLMVEMVPDQAPDGSVNGFYMMATDITERKNIELSQAASEQRLRLIADHLPVIISAIDSERNLQFGNAAYRSWLDVDPDSLPGRSLESVVGRRTFAQASPWLDRAFAGAVTMFESDATMHGEARRLETTFVPDVRRDGSVPAVYALTSDVTRARQVEAELQQQARRDVLTGIANRRMFEEVLEQAVERVRRQESQMALAYLDIDNFKSINDTLGHGAGDEVLKEVAARLQGNVRVTDTAARLAGDEFVLIFEHLHTSEELQVLAHKIMAAFEPVFILSSGPYRVTISLGIALYQGGTETAAGLTGRADMALYETKRRGRDGYTIDSGHGLPDPVLSSV
jgi:diguanylate cyclase (GGDEF)-like protein/PAS domain S-box-containing protein